MVPQHLLLLLLFLFLTTPSAFSRLGPSPSLSSLPLSSISEPSISTSLKAVGPDPLVSKICDNTDHPPLCLATILPFLKANAPTVDVESVLRFAVEASGEYAKEALSVVTNLASKMNTPEVRSSLKDCKDSYETAVENYEKTMEAFATKDVGRMRSVLSAVITFVGDCEDEFAEMQTPSPLSGYAQKLTAMTSNCLAIVSQMK